MFVLEFTSYLVVESRFNDPTIQSVFGGYPNG